MNKFIVAFFAVIMTFALPVGATIVSDPVVIPTQVLFTAAINPASGEVNSYGATWAVNDVLKVNQPVLSPTITELTANLMVQNGDEVCAKLWATNDSGKTGVDEVCLTVSHLPPLPGQPTLAAIQAP